MWKFRDTRQPDRDRRSAPARRGVYLVGGPPKTCTSCGQVNDYVNERCSACDSGPGSRGDLMGRIWR